MQSPGPSALTGHRLNTTAGDKCWPVPEEPAPASPKAHQKGLGRFYYYSAVPLCDVIKNTYTDNTERKDFLVHNFILSKAYI